ncbi:MAG: DUF697 domain-containing protein [Opitutales bacterium]|nr:DUF697 domain-containing protein [Opitutales bacterium]
MKIFESNTDTQAQETVKKYVVYATSTSFIPLPFADLATLIAVQLNLVKSLAGIYKVPYDESATKSRVKTLIGAIGTNTIASSLLRSFIKTIPGIGTILGSVSQSLAAGSITYGIGQIFIVHFREGGDLNNLSLDTIKPFFREQVKRGLDVARDLQSKDPEKLPEPPDDLRPSAQRHRVYCIIKPKLGKGGKVYLKGYFQGKRPEKYIATIPALQERYAVEDLDPLKDQIVADYLPVYETFLEEKSQPSHKT